MEKREIFREFSTKCVDFTEYLQKKKKKKWGEKIFSLLCKCFVKSIYHKTHHLLQTRKNVDFTKFLL